MMKQWVVAGIFLFTVVPLGANSQVRKTAPTQTSKQSSAQSFPPFWTKFKAAVLKGDKETVASMTQLPFLLEGEELDRAKFIEKFDSLFDKQIKRYLTKSKPVRDGEYYEVACGDNSLMFKKVAGQYKFVEIGVND